MDLVTSENQGRGTIHAHMMVRLTNSLDLIKHCGIVRAGRHAFQAMTDVDLLDKQREKLKEEIRKGKISENKVINFCDLLITTINPMAKEERETFKPATGLRHPCSRRIGKMSEAESDTDYMDIINSVQRHRKCTDHCLREKMEKRNVNSDFLAN